MSKKMKTFLIVLLVIGVAVAGYFLYKRAKDKKEAENEQNDMSEVSGEELVQTITQGDNADEESETENG